MLTQKNQVHFKMYKSGKFWLVSGVALITFGLGNSLDIPTNSGNSVSADSVNTSLNNANSDLGNSQKAQAQMEQLPDESKVVTETIHYQYSDGTPAADDYTKKITFTRTVSKNLNTQETSYGDWKSDSATFSSVKSPEIPGYTADQQEISIHDSNVESNDKNFTVTYHKESDNNVDARNLQLKTATNNIKESQIDKQSIDIKDSNGDIKSLSSNSNSIQLPSAQFSPKNINFSGRINNYNSGDSITIPFSISNVSNSSQATWAAVQKDIPGVGYISFVADQQNYPNGTYSGKYVIHVTHDISTEKSYTVSLGAGLFINSYDSTKPISIKLGTDNYTITPTPREYPKDDSNFYGSGWLARVAPNQINASTGTWDSNYYNNLLSSNGENIGNTNIPTGDFVTIQHVKSINGNIINVAKDSEYTTSLSFSKDGSELIKNDNSAIYHSNILGTEVHLDVNMTDIDIAKQLAQYGNNSYAVIKNSDGSYTVAYNYGNLLKRNGFSMMDYYQNKVGTVSNSDQSPENKRDDTTDSKINNSLANKQSLRNQNDFKFIFQDPTMENVLTASTSFFNVTDNEASLISPVTSDKNNTIPNDSLAAGQTEIKVSYVDDYGNPLTTDDVYFGYPQDVDSSVNAHPSENPVINTKSISGYSLVTDQSVSPSWLKTSDIWLNSTSNNIAFPLSSSHNTVQQVYFVYTKNAPTVTTETKTITRTIKYVDAVDGHEVANEVQQPVTLTRTATTDAVTHAVTYSDWHIAGTWDQVDSPVVAGYDAPDRAKIDAVHVTSDTNDDTEVVKYNHHTDSKTETKTVTRTIKYVDAVDGHEVANEVQQPVTLTRTATTDAVTHAVTYSDWHIAGTWDQVDSPVVAGYDAPDRAKIDAVHVTSDTNDDTEVVKYNHQLTPHDSTNSDSKINSELISNNQNSYTSKNDSINSKNTLPNTGKQLDKLSNQSFTVGAIFLSFLGMLFTSKKRNNK